MSTKTYLIALLLFIPMQNLRARSGTRDTYGDSNTWTLKGKVFPWIALGGGINYTLGLEYGFRKHQSVGIDVSYDDFSSEHDVYDVGKQQYVSGPRVYTVWRGVFLNYRRYFVCKHTFIDNAKGEKYKTSYLPYLSAFGRYGKTDLHYEPGYITDNLSYDEWQYSVGCLLGVVTESFDINIGPFYKQRYITDVEEEFGKAAFHTHMQPILGIRLGVNLMLNIKKSDHVLSRYLY